MIREGQISLALETEVELIFLRLEVVDWSSPKRPQQLLSNDVKIHITKSITSVTARSIGYRSWVPAKDVHSLSGPWDRRLD